MLAWLPSVALMAMITYLSHQSQWPEVAQGFPDWILHGGTYALLTLFNWFGLIAGTKEPPRAVHAFRALLGSSLFGLVDEWHQSFIPGRAMSAWDWAADILGASFAALLLGTLKRR